MFACDDGLVRLAPGSRDFTPQLPQGAKFQMN